eukprot:m.101009 g.101009  ORF g.101009 m.101009 type:complete len:144 (+) comp37109_c0_seq2:288-719(+)
MLTSKGTVTSQKKRPNVVLKVVTIKAMLEMLDFRERQEGKEIGGDLETTKRMGKTVYQANLENKEKREDLENEERKEKRRELVRRVRVSKQSVINLDSFLLYLWMHFATCSLAKLNWQTLSSMTIFVRLQHCIPSFNSVQLTS